MGLDLVRLVNLSSVTDKDVLGWAGAVLPRRAIKLVPVEDMPEQDSKVLVLYDSLVRRLTECAAQAGKPVDVEAEIWAAEGQRIVDLISVNPEHRICLETDATAEAKTLLATILGDVDTVPDLRPSAPEIGLPTIIAQVLFQQSKDLTEIQSALDRIGVTQAAPTCLQPQHLALVLDQARALQERVCTGERAVSERERWLELLRGTAWEATTRAQHAEARARDLEARLKRAEQQARSLQSTKTLPSSDFAQMLKDRDNQQQRIAELTEENAGLRHQIVEILTSTSWRLTSPVRKLRQMVSR
ncbi:hypothetical protein [Roseovarius sp. 217]|uniref:hypothetical protein n=1 Tax=Roseovarius sp. (strain 217) TaxID=314264 RepID=UPI000068495E|nr:hypothetical protein [Roseovarius sp. 217]EAQ25820.1 hypothetical protein ROS217_05724 [Roseovarius sp. 217]